MIPDPVRYCPACGTAVVEQIAFGRPRPVCPACGRVHFYDPKVAVGVLVERDRRILLVRRVMEPGRGLWSLPAGFVDAGEDPSLAAVREALEETGFQVDIAGVLDVLGGRAHPRGADMVIVYRASIVGGELRAGDDASEAEFFDPDDLPPLAFDVTRRSIEAWKKERTGPS